MTNMCWAGVKDCPECKSGKYDINKGDRIKVEFEAEFTHFGMATGRVMLKLDGVETWAPANAKVTVVKRAVPDEPPVSSSVGFKDGSVWTRFSAIGLVTMGRWFRSDSTSEGPLTWAELIERKGEPTWTSKVPTTV